jgi:hypothetical protein
MNKEKQNNPVKGEEKDLAFEERYLHNMAFLPSEFDKEFMGDNAYNAALAEHELAYKQVVFDNICVVYDSDGDEYSHTSWPYEVCFLNHKKEVECFFEDDGIYILYNDHQITWPQIKELTIGNFIKGLDLIGVPYDLTEYGESLYSKIHQQSDINVVLLESVDDAARTWVLQEPRYSHLSDWPDLRNGPILDFKGGSEWAQSRFTKDLQRLQQLVLDKEETIAKLTQVIKGQQEKLNVQSQEINMLRDALSAILEQSSYPGGNRHQVKSIANKALNTK